MSFNFKAIFFTFFDYIYEEKYIILVSNIKDLEGLFEFQEFTGFEQDLGPKKVQKKEGIGPLK